MEESSEGGDLSTGILLSAAVRMLKEILVKELRWFSAAFIPVISVIYRQDPFLISRHFVPNVPIKSFPISRQSVPEVPRSFPLSRQSGMLARGLYENSPETV